MLFHNDDLLAFTKTSYSPADLARLEEALRNHGTLTFDRLSTGLFPASHRGPASKVSGYEYVWVRDNVFVAYAHLLDGQPQVAREVVTTLLQFFAKYRHRFADVTSRPQVRFDGEHLTEVDQPWTHAQNDAFGYLLWLAAQVGDLDGESWLMVELIIRHLHAIRYWEDRDSGHWEETPKISASSIGTVIAGLEALRSRFDVRELIDVGRVALRGILPNECIELDPRRNRRYDAALAFLIFPLQVIDGALAELVLHDIERYLAGEIGIRRYLRDSFWAPDYDTWLVAEERTRDFSNDMEMRDALIHGIGREAQWCIFDPILSAAYGRRGDREKQLHHFHRALGQITGSWQCPELYYRKGGTYIAGPQTPLQWTQANLLIALRVMEETADAAR